MWIENIDCYLIKYKKTIASLYDSNLIYNEGTSEDY